MVKLLLEHKALVDLPSKEGVTPLMAAAGVEFGTRVTRGRNRTTEGVLATMQLLLDAGADINARMVVERRERGCPTATSQAASLHPRAAGPAQPGARRAERGAGPDGACMGAAQRGFTPVVTFLVEHGADLQAKDASRDARALDLAKGVGVPGVRQAEGEGFLGDRGAYIESLLTKVAATRRPRGAHLPHGRLFDLTHAFARHRQPAADLLERHLPFGRQAVAQAQHLALAVVERGHGAFHLGGHLSSNRRVPRGDWRVDVLAAPCAACSPPPRQSACRARWNARGVEQHLQLRHRQCPGAPPAPRAAGRAQLVGQLAARAGRFC